MIDRKNLSQMGDFIVFICTFAAPFVEFTKPLTDLEVKEKENARFECEISRESAKVIVTASLHVLAFLHIFKPL